MIATSINSLVTIVVPCYNQAIFLPETLDSILDQSYKDWKCIIVNDGSSDNTEEIAISYCKKDSRFSYISKRNGGLSSARNSGIKVAQTKYILPLDSDDKIAAGYLQAGIDFLESHNDYSLFYCQASFFDAKTDKWEIAYKGYKNLLKQNSIFCSSIFQKKDWERAGGYDETFLNGLEDWDFYIRLLDEKSKVYQSSTTFFYYRKAQNKKSMTDSFEKNYHSIALKIYTKYIDLYVSYFGDPLEIVWGTHWSQRKIVRIAHRIQLILQRIINVIRN